MKKQNNGFSLIELLVVVAIIAIVATIALSRLSGVQTKSADALNMANLSRIGPALEAYMVANDRKLNRLDLVVTGKASGTVNTYSTSTAELLILTNSTLNVGIAGPLYYSVTQYGLTFPPLLTQYHLTQSDVDALKSLGLTYLMRYNNGSRFNQGDDGEWPTGSSTDPDTCLSLSTSISNGLAVPCVNPITVSGSGGSIAPYGALVYQACGQDVRFSLSQQILINGTPCTNTSTDVVMPQLKSNGGILLAFGIGQYASVIGSTRSGLDSAPVCPAVKSDTYRRYFLLIRLATESGTTKAEYAGVMDSSGQTMKQLRLASK